MGHLVRAWAFIPTPASGSHSRIRMCVQMNEIAATFAAARSHEALL